MTTESFEDQLRRALRPVDAPAGFTDRLMAALPAERPAARVTPLVVAAPAPAPRARRNFYLPVALAASLVCAVLLGQQMAGRRAVLEDQRLAALEEARGREASRQLMQALRITSQKLDIAYEAMNEPRAQDAEENQS